MAAIGSTRITTPNYDTTVKKQQEEAAKVQEEQAEAQVEVKNCVESSAVAPEAPAEETDVKTNTENKSETAAPMAQAPTGDWNASLSDLKAQLKQKEAELWQLNERLDIPPDFDAMIKPTRIDTARKDGESMEDCRKRNDAAWAEEMKQLEEEYQKQVDEYEKDKTEHNAKIAQLEGEIAALKEKISTLEVQGANSASPSPTNEPTSTSTWEIKNGVNI